MVHIISYFDLFRNALLYFVLLYLQFKDEVVLPEKEQNKNISKCNKHTFVNCAIQYNG